MTQPIRPPGKGQPVIPPAPPGRSLFVRLWRWLGLCRHHWGLLGTVLLPSPYELMAGQAGQLLRSGPPPKWLFQKTHATIIQCHHCGKVRKQVVTNP